MIIGTLREVKDNENRVGLTPEGIKKLVKAGHIVFVERQAGWGSGFTDIMYEQAGAKLRDSAYDIVQRSDLIIKIKEPVPAEYYWLDFFKEKTLFTYLHLSGVDPQLTQKLLENKITAIAYETISKNGKLPLLAPMSQVAGVLACQFGAHYLQKKHGGAGVTLGHIDGADSALTVIIGAGFVGLTAALTIGGMGSKAVLLDINPQAVQSAKKKIRSHLGPILSRNVSVQVSNQQIIEKWVSQADLLIGAVLIPGAKAPQVVSEKMINLMKRGAVIVDVAIDQGGCIWGSRPTSHRHPIYDLNGKIYCCIPNMPGQASHQSTQALTNATLPYLLEIAEIGVIEALRRNINLRRGLNTFHGKITYESVARDLKLESFYEPVEKALGIGDRVHGKIKRLGVKAKSQKSLI